MTFRFKKTGLWLLIGIMFIYLVMMYEAFDTPLLSEAFKNPDYVIKMNTLNNGAKGYKINSLVWESQSDDAWIEVILPKAKKIKELLIDIDWLDDSLSQTTQIYYTRGKEIKGNMYNELVMHNGVNIISLTEKPKVKMLRFDITDQANVSFQLNSITVRFTRENQILFWILTPLLILIYSTIIIFFINKDFFIQWMENKTRIKYKYEVAEQVISLSCSDFKSRFTGSYLGMFWGILQPLSTILLFWFVFQVGFRSNPINDVPFILWLAAGMIPWNYFYDSWFGGTGSFTSYNYIVKKVVFNVELLPIVKIMASAILNIIFNIILLIIYTLYGEFPGFHILDMIYFSGCTMALTLGLSYITATLNVFIKDIGQFLGIALQFLMWLTPMMWDYHMIPEKFSWFYKLNPLHYIINGYREALIYGNLFYYHWVQMLWFWCVTLGCLIGGKKLLKRLKCHFADVL